MRCCRADCQPAASRAAQALRKIHPQNVGADQLQVGKARLQGRDQIPVQLNRHIPGGIAIQIALSAHPDLDRSRAADRPVAAGPHRQSAATRLHRPGSADQSASGLEAPYSQPLTRSVALPASAPHGSCQGSLRPVPARSSAVPWSTDVRTNGRPRVTFTASPKP